MQSIIDHSAIAYSGVVKTDIKKANTALNEVMQWILGTQKSMILEVLYAELATMGIETRAYLTIRKVLQISEDRGHPLNPVVRSGARSPSTWKAPHRKIATAA